MEFEILRGEVSYRGGGVEIDLTPLGFEGERMAAYQNYLGGGLLGRVCVNDTITAHGKEVTDEELALLEEIGENLKRYYHKLTNPDTEWEGMDYERNQRMPASGY